MQIIHSQTRPIGSLWTFSSLLPWQLVRPECLQCLGRYSRAWRTYGRMDTGPQRRGGHNWMAGRQTDRQTGDGSAGRRASVKHRGTRRRSKQCNVYFRPSVFSVDSPSYAFSESVQAKLPQQQQCGAEYEIRHRVCVCEQQQLAVSLSGEMAAAAARHSSQLWSEMMCVFWPEEAKGSRLVCRRQPDRRWQLPFSRQAKAERGARLWLLRHFTVSTSSLPRPLMLCHWSFSRSPTQTRRVWNWHHTHSFCFW